MFLLYTRFYCEQSFFSDKKIKCILSTLLLFFKLSVVWHKVRNVGHINESQIFFSRNGLLIKLASLDSQRSVTQRSNFQKCLEIRRNRGDYSSQTTLYKGQNDQREMNKFGGNKLSF